MQYPIPIILIEMTLTGATLKKLTKEEIIKLTLDHDDNFNQDLKSTKKDLSELRENFFKLEADLAVIKEFNNVLRDQMVRVKRKSCSNSSLEETALNIFQ